MAERQRWGDTVEAGLEYIRLYPDDYDFIKGIAASLGVSDVPPTPWRWSSPSSLDSPGKLHRESSRSTDRRDAVKLLRHRLAEMGQSCLVGRDAGRR